jgi:peptidyl-prolyl cis-trans isomerase SurA
LEFQAARTGFADEMIFMANRLFKVVGLAALVAFPAHSQNLSVPDHVVAIATNLRFITEDDVDQRTKLDLLLEQKQVDREGVIRELSIDIDKIAKAEGAGLLSDALVDKAFADMCSRLGVASADLMKTLEEKGIRLDTLRKRLRSDVWRECQAMVTKIDSITLSFPRCHQAAIADVA